MAVLTSRLAQQQTTKQQATKQPATAPRCWDVGKGCAQTLEQASAQTSGLLLEAKSLLEEEQQVEVVKAAKSFGVVAVGAAEVVP